MVREWKRLRIGDCFDLVGGYAFKSADFIQSGIPVIKIKNVKPNQMLYSDLSYVDASFLKLRPDKIVKKGDILITMSGNRFDGSPDTWVGKVAQFNEGAPFLLNQRVGILQPKDGIDLDRRFFCYVLSSQFYQTEFISIATSSGGQANLSPSQILGAPVDVPPLPEQKAIASILGALDDKIELNRRMNATLEAMARALFQSWFVDFDPVRAKLDGRQPAGLDPATAALFPASFQDSPLGPIPAGWKVKRWGDISTLEYGKSLRDYRTGRGKYRVYGTNGPIGFHDEFLSEKPGIVIGRKGAYRGVHYSAEPFYVIDTAFYLRPSQPLDVFWAYFELLQFDINGMDSGSAIPSTSRDDFYGIPVVHPPLDIQRKFGSLAAGWFQRIKLNSEENDSLSKVRDLLLSQLLSGSAETKNVPA
jgi:type I restriction enzyme S subunit